MQENDRYQKRRKALQEENVTGKDEKRCKKKNITRNDKQQQQHHQSVFTCPRVVVSFDRDQISVQIEILVNDVFLQLSVTLRCSREAYTDTLFTSVNCHRPLRKQR